MRMMTTAHPPQRARAALLAPVVVVLLAMVLVVWWALDPRSTALMEEWPFYQDFSQGALPWMWSSSRPLLLSLLWVASHLTPGSYLGANLLTAAICLGNGVVVFVLIRRLRPTEPLFAYITALLFPLYPAETGWYDLRLLGHVECVFCYLLAAWWFVCYWEKPRLLTLLGVWGALFLSLATVESTYAIAALTPALLLWLNRGLSWRVVRVALLWYALLLLWGIRAVVIYLTTPPLGGLQMAHESMLTRLAALEHDMRMAYGRVLKYGWIDAYHALVPRSPTSYLVMAVMALVALMGIFFLRRSVRVSSVRETSWHPVTVDAAWGFVGLVVVGAGYIMFAPFAFYAPLTERVYNVASLGGALIIAALLTGCWHITRWLGVPVLAVVSIAVGLSVGYAAHGALRMRSISLQEQRFLAAIVQAAPHVRPGTTLVLLDPTHQFSFYNQGSTFPNIAYLQSAVQLATNQTTLVVWCDPGLPLPTRPLCTFTRTAIAGVWLDGNDGEHPYRTDASHVVILRDDGENAIRVQDTWPVAGATTYAPHRLISGPLPASVHTLFTSWPVPAGVPLNEVPQTSFRLNGGIDDVEIDDGATLPVLSLGWLKANGDNWVGATRAVLWLWLQPGSAYRVQMHVSQWLVWASVQHLRLRVGQTNVPLHVVLDEGGKGALITGVIPASAFVRQGTGTEVLWMTTPVYSPLQRWGTGDVRALAFAVDWLHISQM